MKKIVVLFGVIGISVSCAFGQTYYYKHTETIDQNGAKSQGKGGKYFTFSGNSFYESDKDGYKIKNTTSVYVLQKSGTVDFYLSDEVRCKCGAYSGGYYEGCRMRLQLDGTVYRWAYVWDDQTDKDIIILIDKFISTDVAKEQFVYNKKAGPEEERGPANFY
jgi:hypothetical protein